MVRRFAVEQAVLRLIRLRRGIVVAISALALA